MTDLNTFTSVQLKRGYTEVRRAALRAPVGISHNGAHDLVLMPRDSFEALVSLSEPRHRYADELSEATVAALREPLPDREDATDGEPGTTGV